MAYTRKQVVTCVSIVWLIFTAAVSGYAFSHSRRLSIPISNTLSGFTTALPITSGLFLEAAYDFTRYQERKDDLRKGEIVRPPFVIAAHALILIYSAVVITLLGTHVTPPSGLKCGLEERWEHLFSHKDDEAVRTIQNFFQCCGFMNSHDRAWPFPDKSHDAHACESAFGRSVGCLGPWKQEEQRLAGILMAVVVLVFLWQITIIAMPTRRESWVHQVLPDRVSRMVIEEENGRAHRPRRSIDYLPTARPYREAVADDVSDDDESTAQGGVENGSSRAGHEL